MNVQKIIQELKDKASKYIQFSPLDSNEKNMIIALSHLLDVVYLFYKKAEITEITTSVYGSKDEESLDDEISEAKEQLNNFLSQNYKPKEFSILSAVTFSNSSQFIKILLENMCYYFNDYEINKKYLNIYYYLFHLIYFVLSIISKGKETNHFEEDIIKFYIYHITHFFLNDKKNPEYNFFFYEGAFKFLDEKFNISFSFLFNLEDDILPIINISNDVQVLISTYHSKLSSVKDQSNDELNFIGNYSTFYKKILAIMNEENDTNDAETEGNILLKKCSFLKKKIEQVKKILDDNKVSCIALNNYKKIVENLIQIIKENNLTLNDFNLMLYNFEQDNRKMPVFEKLLKLAKTWENYHHAVEQNYTPIFSKIINSEDFKTLYSTTMKSSYVKDFVKASHLTKSYDIFMKDYADELYKYILYVPLTRGIKAYVSNYFRIALNTNSIDLIDISNDKSKEDILKSYLLIIFIRESFHFIYRITKEGESASKTLSPQTKKLRESYNEIGVDIILFLFGTEYITFISEENSKLLNNIESWKKDNTDFKVFEQVYLFCGDLIHANKKKNIGSGLKCNISVNENEKIQWKMCTDSAVRFCL